MATTERLIGQLKADVASANKVVWSPDGTRLAVSGNGGISVLAIEGPVVSYGTFAASRVECCLTRERVASDTRYGAMTHRCSA